MAMIGRVMQIYKENIVGVAGTVLPGVKDVGLADSA